MNATVQVLHAIPELQIALNACAPPPTDIASSLRDLFASMNRVKNTKGTVTPTDLLRQLRMPVSQGVVTDTGGTQYIQQGQSCYPPSDLSLLIFLLVSLLTQDIFFVLIYLYYRPDAQECWMQIIDSLKDVLISSEVGSATQKKFVRQYMTTEICRE
jgi:hypothetical protein